jgi:hypothetical protein
LPTRRTNALASLRRPVNPVTGRPYRSVSDLTESTIRLALPDGWDARQVRTATEAPQTGAVQAGEWWVAESRAGKTIEAEVPELLLARVWQFEADAKYGKPPGDAPPQRADLTAEWD